MITPHDKQTRCATYKNTTDAPYSAEIDILPTTHRELR